MLRKLLLTGVASLGLLTPLALVPTAGAHEFLRESYHHGRHHERDYRVFYRRSCYAPWVCGGTFDRHREAERCAEGYRCHGYEVEIR